MRVVSFLLLLCVTSSTLADDWPQWLGPQRDGVWRETGVLQDFSDGPPAITWRAPVGGGYSGVAVANGRVFLTDYLRSSGDPTPNPDVKSELQGTERVLCLDEKTGKLLWKHEYAQPYNISYPAGPRATPTVDGDRVYTLGAQGMLLCLDVASGAVLWQRSLGDDYHAAPIWGFAAHPLIDGNRLYCLAGGKGSAVVALDKHTGGEVWKSLTTDDIGYAPPTLFQMDGKRQLIVWLSDSLNSVVPETGKPNWSVPFEPDYKMSIAQPQQIGAILFVGAIKHKSMALRVEAGNPNAQSGAQIIWRGDRPGVGVGPSHAPVAFDPADPSHIYGIDRGGELRCVELETGKQIWESYALMASGRRSNSGTAFLTRHEDLFYIFSETAELVIARLTPEGYHEVARTEPLLETTHDCFGRGVVWCPPAFANQAMLVRNDKELIRVSLKAQAE